MEARQLRLGFDGPVWVDGRIANGTIVAQSWAWIGDLGGMIPYWQIRFCEDGRERIRREVLGAARRSRSEAQIEREIGRQITELRPEQRRQLSYYCRAVPMGRYPEQIHWFGHEDLIDTGGRWRVPEWSEVEGWCREAGGWSQVAMSLGSPERWKPYPQGQELVEILDALIARGFPDWKTRTTCDEYEDAMEKLLRRMDRQSPLQRKESER
jgi:hypothetical protein